MVAPVAAAPDMLGPLPAEPAIDGPGICVPDMLPGVVVPPPLVVTVGTAMVTSPAIAVTCGVADVVTVGGGTAIVPATPDAVMSEPVLFDGEPTLTEPATVAGAAVAELPV